MRFNLNLKLIFFFLILGVSEHITVFDDVNPRNFLVYSADSYVCRSGTCDFPLEADCEDSLSNSTLTHNRNYVDVCYSFLSVSGKFEFDEIDLEDEGLLMPDSAICEQNENTFAVVHACHASTYPCNSVSKAMERINQNVYPMFCLPMLRGACMYGADTGIKENGLDYDIIERCFVNGSLAGVNADYDDYIQFMTDYGATYIGIIIYDEVTGQLIGEMDHGPDYGVQFSLYASICKMIHDYDDLHFFGFNPPRQLEKSFDWQDWPFPIPRYEYSAKECFDAFNHFIIEDYKMASSAISTITPLLLIFASSIHVFA